MKGIGIDTGGTCTDAVIYDFETGQVLSKAKTLTTHHDLKIGITEALRQLPEDLLRQCGQAALSTTLATNACVENLGGRGKIIFLGVSRKVFNETWRSYGFRSLDDILLVACRIPPLPKSRTGSCSAADFPHSSRTATASALSSSLLRTTAVPMN